MAVYSLYMPSDLVKCCRYVFGVTHIPRLEDWPVMPVERIGFMLMVVLSTLAYFPSHSLQILKEIHIEIICTQNIDYVLIQSYNI